jgi:hypothetical protein
MKIESDRPAVNALNEVIAVGSSQDASKEMPSGEEPALARASTVNRASTAIWNATRTYWTRLVACTPR